MDVTTHPMSPGQQRRVWRVQYRDDARDPVLADLVPCAVADLKVGDHHLCEGTPGVMVVWTVPAFIDGQWTGKVISADEEKDWHQGKILVAGTEYTEPI